jgi:hypothetical protein
MTYKQTFTEKELSVLTAALAVSIGAISGIQEEEELPENIVDLFTTSEQNFMEAFINATLDNKIDPNYLLKEAWDILHQKEGQEDERI